MTSTLKTYSSFASLSGNVKNNSIIEESTLLECRVCNDVYTAQGQKVPRLLHCGHTVCHECLSQLPLCGMTILCPFDRQPSVLTDSGVWCLNKNFALLELQEKLSYIKSNQNQNFTNQYNRSSNNENQLSPTKCEENDRHVAVIYCTVCATNLCYTCSETIHATRTLSRHKRVPLSEKPKELPKCPIHPLHPLEFVCIEDDCQNDAFMCCVCKDFGQHASHKHALLGDEAANVRAAVMSALQQTKMFGCDVLDLSQRLSGVISEIEGSMSFAQAPDGTSVMQEIPGTATQMRTRVRQYFSSLREALDRQELAAMTTVDTYIRERLCLLRQEQEDLSILLTQIATVCSECEKTLLGQDDTKLLIAKRDISLLLELITKQQQQFSDLSEQLSLDTTVPVTFTKDNRIHIGSKVAIRVVILGLDGSGKTSILFKLKQNECVQTIPTIGFNVETIEYKNLQFTIWDVGGHQKLRPLWKHYYHNTQAVIFVMDSNCPDRLQEAHHELNKLLQEPELREASLLLLANKQDSCTAMGADDLTHRLNLFKLCSSRSWHILSCDSKTGSGLKEALEWLSCQMVVATAECQL